MYTNLYNLRYYLILAIVFFIPFQNRYIFGNNYLFLPMVAFLLYFVVAVISRQKRIFTPIYVNRFVLPLVLLLLIIITMNAISSTSSDLNAVGTSYMQRFISFIVLFVLLTNEIRINHRLLYVLPKVFVFSMIIFFSFFQFGADTFSESGRMSVEGLNSNTIGYWAAISILFSSGILFEQHNLQWVKIYHSISIIMMFFLIAQTGSRGAAISLFAGIFTLFVFQKKSFIKKIKIVIPGLILFGLLFFMILNIGVLKERFIEESEVQTFGSRKSLWEVSYRVYAESPIFGLGSSEFDAEATKIIGIYRSQHNEYLRLLGYSGIVGLSLFLLFYYRIFNGIFIVRKTAGFKWQTGPLALMVMSASFLFVAGSALVTFQTWFIFIYAVSYIYVENQKIPQHLGLKNRRQLV